MTTRRLLICFDAFDTLFTPKTPVIHQYGEVARSLGLRQFSDDDLARSFAAAYKRASKDSPNFGKATGMGPVKWWTNIINDSFTGVTDESLPPELVARLIRRFHCDEGYTLFPDVKPLLHKLRRYAKNTDSKIMVGVITNSDDRVPDILKAFDLKVNATRYGDEIQQPKDSDYDIDFTIMSYDVGHEKPDRRIFDAAVEVGSILAGASESSVRVWEKLYVGDEHKKDVVGALSAGWRVALVDRTGTQSTENVSSLELSDTTTLFEAFEQHRALLFGSLAELSSRIPA